MQIVFDLVYEGSVFSKVPKKEEGPLDLTSFDLRSHLGLLIDQLNSDEGASVRVEVESLKGRIKERADELGTSIPFPLWKVLFRLEPAAAPFSEVKMDRADHAAEHGPLELSLFTALPSDKKST